MKLSTVKKLIGKLSRFLNRIGAPKWSKGQGPRIGAVLLALFMSGCALRCLPPAEWVGTCPKSKATPDPKCSPRILSAACPTPDGAPWCGGTVQCDCWRTGPHGSGAGERVSCGEAK